MRLDEQPSDESALRPSRSPASAIEGDSNSVEESSNLVDELANEFSLRCRSGENPSIEEFVQRAPDFQDLIRSLFPTIELLEKITQKEHAERRVKPHRNYDRQQIGDFRIVREIGRGGMGVVYEAIQSSLARRVALKVLGSGISNSPNQLQRFRREAESAARLHHTNIVPVYGIGQEDDIHFYAMQFIDGIPLADAIETVRHRSSIRHSSNRSFESQHTDHSVPGHRPSLIPGREGQSDFDVNEPTQLMVGSPVLDDSHHVLDPSDASSQQSGHLTGSHPSFDASRPDPVHSPNDVPSSETTSYAISKVDSVDACFGLFADNSSPTYFLRIANICAQIADALDYAHQHGVLHRDIKPSNLMLDRSGCVWVMDFGLVKILEQHDLTVDGEIVGTLRYMAPEQLDGRADVTTDVYALGLTLYELLTLKPAFDGDKTAALAQRLRESAIPRPRSINPAIPRDLETIVLKATAREPRARYSSAAMLADDLRSFCDDRPIRARRATYLERLWRWSRRNPALAAATASTILLLGLVDVVATIGKQQVEKALRLTEVNLESAMKAFDSVFENVHSRGLPRSLDLDFLDAEEAQVVPSNSDVQLLDRLLQFYREFAIQNVDNTKLRVRTANAHRRAGAILIRLGRLSEAENDFDTGIDLLSRILESEPHNIEAAVNAASIYNDRGELLLRRGEFFGTFKSHLEARALLLQQLSAGYNDPSIRFELARATDLFASIDIRSGSDEGPNQPMGGKRGGLEMHHDGDHPHGPHSKPGWFHSTDSTGRHAPPTDDGKRKDFPKHGPDGPPPGPPPVELSQRLKNAMPKVFSAEHRVEDGLADVLLEASHEFRALANEFPSNVEYQFRLAQCLRHRLVHAATFGKREVAQEAFREAKTILDGLTTRFPNDPKYLYELTEILNQASRAESNEDAMSFLETAVSNAERLSKTFPSVAEYKLLHGVSLAKRAALEASADNTTDAQVSLSNSIEILERLADEFPDQSVIQIPLAKTSQQLGDLLRTIAMTAENRDVLLERSLTALNSAIYRFEGYLDKSRLDSESQTKGIFNHQVCSNLCLSLAETLTQLNLPEEAKKAQQKARRQFQLDRIPPK